MEFIEDEDLISTKDLIEIPIKMQEMKDSEPTYTISTTIIMVETRLIIIDLRGKLFIMNRNGKKYKFTTHYFEFNDSRL